jgi:hypothetical protein
LREISRNQKKLEDCSENRNVWKIFANVRQIDKILRISGKWEKSFNFQPTLSDAAAGAAATAQRVVVLGFID